MTVDKIAVKRHYSKNLQLQQFNKISRSSSTAAVLCKIQNKGLVTLLHTSDHAKLQVKY